DVPGGHEPSTPGPDSVKRPMVDVIAGTEVGAVGPVDPLLAGPLERFDQPRKRVVAQLRAIRFVIHRLSRGRIAIAGREADLMPTHFAELGGAGLQERSLELGGRG